MKDCVGNRLVDVSPEVLEEWLELHYGCRHEDLQRMEAWRVFLKAAMLVAFLADQKRQAVILATFTAAKLQGL